MEDTEKLDSFSKIIVATSAINYMSNIISLLNADMGNILLNISAADKHFAKNQKADYQKSILNGIEERRELLKSVVNRLGSIMGDLNNCLNNCNGTMPIDERITKTAFEIIVHGNDTVSHH
jgi:hypothetical protein